MAKVAQLRQPQHASWNGALYAQEQEDQEAWHQVQTPPSRDTLSLSKVLVGPRLIEHSLSLSIPDKPSMSVFYLLISFCGSSSSFQNPTLV